ncbi:MAG: tetratricopeptide repeat protein, partial [Thioalkalivibrio sp.]|nr:tetratricopeptide repeat protein [Thioalkalivibrio sp.]
MPPPKKRKPQLPPPPWTWDDEIAALEEVGFDTPLAQTLWRGLRDLGVWRQGGPGREALGREPSPFVAERTALALTSAPELTGPLGTFALLGSNPELCSERQIATACYEIYRWAESRSLSLVAVLFSEAAATVDDDSRWALAAAKSCRVVGRYQRSGQWYARAFDLGRSAKRTSDAVRALLGLGGLLRTLGRLHEALPYFERASRRANRRNRRKLAAETHHDLLLLLTELGEYEQASYHAAGAVLYYAPRNRRLPYLVHDAAFLFIRLHHYTPALMLCEGVPALVPRPNDAALVWSTVAWAAAGAGKREQFHQAEGEALQLLGLSNEHAPAALLHLAEGARALGDWETAKRYAAAAVTAA